MTDRAVAHQGAACWATLFTHAHYLPCLAVLLQSMRACQTRYPLVVMVTETVDARTRERLTRMGCVLRDVDAWRVPHADGSLAFERFQNVWTKLRAFELYEYERVVMIDSDMLMCHNMDELFDRPLERGMIAAALACTCNPKQIPTYPAEWTPRNCGYALRPHPPNDTRQLTKPTHRLINSGVVVLEPSQEQHDNIHTFILQHPERVAQYRFPDQDLLADVYSERVQMLPWHYNALKTLRQCHPDLWNDDEVRIIHYILDKPWLLGPAPCGEHTHLHSLWWNAYASLAAHPATLGMTRDEWAKEVALHVRGI